MSLKGMGIFLLFCISFCFYHCKEQAPPKPDKIADERISQAVPKLWQELASFAELEITEASELNDVFGCKVVQEDGLVRNISTAEAKDLLNRALKGKVINTVIAVECKPNQKFILFVHGRGYGGAIWAQLLLNAETKTLDKVSFDHSAESEGYGSAITYSTFENQFTDKIIQTDEFSFGLKQDNREVSSRSVQIDGISGATITSSAAIEMMNKGLAQYSALIRQL